MTQLYPDWICYPGVVTEVATGQITYTGERGELDFAISNSDTNGSVIECNGYLPGVQLGIGENSRNFEVVLKDPIRVTLVAGPDHVAIGPLSWGGKKEAGGLPGFAVEHLELNGVTVDGRFSQSPLAGYYQTQYGDLVFDGVRLLSTPTTTKWGSRIMGHARSLTVQNCISNGGGQEHAWYVDNPTGLNSYIWFENNICMNWPRTMLQVVTREYPVTGYLNPGAAQGNLDIRGNTAIDCGQHGAHNFTVTGWPKGLIRFKDNYGESPWDTGLFISYYDWKQGELLSTSGHQARRLIWMNNSGRYPNAGRDANGIGDIETVIIRGGGDNMIIQSAKAAFDIEWNGKPNLSTTIESRINPNLWTLPTGVGPWRKNRVTMTEAEVEALWI